MPSLKTTLIRASQVLTLLILLSGATALRADPAGAIDAVPIPIGVATEHGDRTLLRKGETVVLEGTVTLDMSSTGYTKAFLQDPSGAVMLFSRSRFAVDQGDFVRVVGRVSEYHGTPEIRISSCVVLRKNQTVAPLEVSLDEGLHRKNASRLVRVVANVADVRMEAGGTELVLGANPLPVALMVPESLRNHAWRAGAELEITGIIDNRDRAGIRVWEIYPQTEESVKVLNPGSRLSKRALLVVATVLSIVLIGSFIWTLLLRIRIRTADRELQHKHQLQEVLDRLEEAQSLANVSSWELEIDTGTILCHAPRFYQSLGLDPKRKSVPFATAFACVHQDDRGPASALLDTAALEGKPFSMDLRLSAHDGVERIAYVRVQPLIGPSGRPERLLGVFQDVTDQRSLQRAAEQAQRLDTVGTLAASLAHEFNNVLMSIQTVSEVLERRATDPAGRTACQRIQASISRGKAVSERILRFSRPATPMREAVAVDPFLASLRDELRETLGSGVALEIVPVPRNERLWISADRAQLSQALITLAVNAREAMPNGGRFRIAARSLKSDSPIPFSRVATPDCFVHFVIEDTGCGMDSATLQRALEPLFTTKRTGTGLGLPVVEQIVKLHAGSLLIESTPGEGTTIHLLIPRENPSENLLPGEPHVEIQPRRSILLVEDDPTIVVAMTMLLEEEGMQIVPTETGQEAIAALNSWRPDLVVLDIGLPDMNGMEVYEEVRRRWPDLPVILSTGHGESVAEMSSPGPVVLLRKPYELSELLAAMDRLTDLEPADHSTNFFGLRN